MPTEIASALIVQLLSRLLARRTNPGQGHVILSEAEYDARLRSALDTSTTPGGNITAEVNQAAFRMLRNQLVHGQIETTNYDRLLQVLNVELEPGLQGPVHAVLKDIIDELRRHRDHDVELAAAAAVTDSFVEQLVAESDLLGKLETEEATRLGRRAASQVVASARWAQVVGDRLSTTQVARLLGVSRQALAKRQATGSLLGLTGDGTSWYPTWQFDIDRARIRPEVRDIIGAFRDRLDDVEPLVVASWATTHQEEDLAGETPAQWLGAGRDPEQLRRAAERAAARLAR
ncbi:MAG: hypothetical protein ACR2HR_10385 [Euzebya sp.]